MVDTKFRTLLTLVQVGNYTKTAKLLSLTQPAVSHHVKKLEEEYGVRIFFAGRKTPILTPEGEILIKYAKRLAAIDKRLRQELLDSKTSIKRFNVGVTPVIAGDMISQLFFTYCNEHPDVRINVILDTFDNIYNKLQSFELDWAIVEGQFQDTNYQSLLLDTDDLLLVVSPKHRFSGKTSVNLDELKEERLILRSHNSGTRVLFEKYLNKKGEDIDDFNIVIEIDNVNTIKELVEANLGVTVLGHSACLKEEQAGELSLVYLQDFDVTRKINMIYHAGFEHVALLENIRRIYNEEKEI